MSTLEPEIYKATVHGIPDQLLITISNDGDDTWALSQRPVAGTRYHPREALTDVRPLIILDPESLNWPEENRDKTCELARMIRLMCNSDGDTYRSTMVSQIADLLDPPKSARIKELGWCGKVTARTVENSRRRNWLHFDVSISYGWIDGNSNTACWDDLIDPVLLKVEEK